MSTQTIESLFHTVLSSFECINKLLPCGAKGIYPVVLPNKPEFPAMVYSFVGATSNPTFDTAGFTRYRVEVNCFGKTYKAANTVRAAVISELNGYYDGNMSIEKIHPIDFYDHELLLFRCLVEFYVSSVL